MFTGKGSRWEAPLPCLSSIKRQDTRQPNPSRARKIQQNLVSICRWQGNPGGIREVEGEDASGVAEHIKQSGGRSSCRGSRRGILEHCCCVVLFYLFSSQPIFPVCILFQCYTSFFIYSQKSPYYSSLYNYSNVHHHEISSIFYLFSKVSLL